MDNEKAAVDQDYTILVYSKNADVRLRQKSCNGCTLENSAVAGFNHGGDAPVVPATPDAAPAEPAVVPAEPADVTPADVTPAEPADVTPVAPTDEVPATTDDVTPAAPTNQNGTAETDGEFDWNWNENWGESDDWTMGD